MATEVIGEPVFLWADTEFTGAAVNEGHVVLEVAGVVTDAALNELDSIQTFVHQPEELVREMMTLNPFWITHGHLARVMLRGIKDAPLTAQVDMQLQSFCDEYFKSQDIMLAGNTIHGDLQHIRSTFPDFAKRLHYRIFDLSSIADFFSLYHGIDYSGKKYPHRALPDVHESLDQARFLLKKTGVQLAEVLAV